MWRILFCGLIACATHHKIAVDGGAEIDGHVDRWGAWPLPTTVHAVAEPSLLVAWDAEMRWHVEDFDFALTAYACPPPFTFVAPTDAAEHEIRLSSTGDVEMGMNGGETAGPAGEIVIRGTPATNPQLSPLRGIIAHELGHAIGLPHADPSDGMSAMTVPPSTQLWARDAAALACILGCGPC